MPRHWPTVTLTADIYMAWVYWQWGLPPRADGCIQVVRSTNGGVVDYTAVTDRLTGDTSSRQQRQAPAAGRP